MKRVVRYLLNEEVPSNAKFIAKDSVFFYYEVPISTAKKVITINTFENEIDEVIIYLNEKTGKNYSLKTEKTRKLIFKWIKQGYGVSQFYIAIDNMCEAWLGDPKMGQYLRPDTLFGGKFEGYYNRGKQPSEESLFNELDEFYR